MGEKTLGQVVKEAILNDSRTAWNGEPERINSAYDAAANAVKAAIAKWPRCERCKGTGLFPDLRPVMQPKPTACPACDGLGRVEPDGR